jgi:hypothetical protein
MVYQFSNLTVGQYQRLIRLKENPKAHEVIEALTGKSKNQLTVKELESVKFGNLNPPETVDLANIVVHDGVPYGRVNMENLTYGEFVDLLEYGKDLNKHLVDVVALMWRPITEMDWKNEWRIKWGNMLLKRGSVKRAMKQFASIQYELEPYDPVKCDLRHKVIQEFPANTAHWAVTFFLNFSKQLKIDSHKSLIQFLETSQKEMKKVIKEITSKEV